MVKADPVRTPLVDTSGLDTSGIDVVDLLVAQHARIRELFLEATSTTGSDRADAVHRLVRLLAVHETAEEEIVHPLARTTAPGGDALVDDRLREEHDANELLARIDGMDADDPGLPRLLDELRAAVLRHARSEERYEFTWLRQRCSPEVLQSLATAVRAAERVAPTHPHPGTETATRNLLTGPVAALTDRVRDAVRGSVDGHRAKRR